MTGGRRSIGAMFRLRTEVHSYAPLVTGIAVILLLAGVAMAGATGGDELLVVVTPLVVMLAVLALPQNDALQVILGAVTLHFLIVVSGWDKNERDFDILVTCASALAGFVGLRNRPWLSQTPTGPTASTDGLPGARAADELGTAAVGSGPIEGNGALRPVLRLRAAQAAMLSKRQQMIVHLSIHGMTARDIGERLEISDRTVESHLRRAYAKLGVHSRHELIRTLLESAGDT
jgi:DNA-binding CsgD family transcriptional regulator